MEPWALTTAATFTKRLAFVEKDIAGDGVAAKYGVRGTPTFVLIDAKGSEIDRFNYQPTAAEFAARIEQGLLRAAKP